MHPDEAEVVAAPLLRAGGTFCVDQREQPCWRSQLHSKEFRREPMGSSVSGDDDPSSSSVEEALLSAPAACGEDGPEAARSRTAAAGGGLDYVKRILTAHTHDECPTPLDAARLRFLDASRSAHWCRVYARSLRIVARIVDGSTGFSALRAQSEDVL